MLDRLLGRSKARELKPEEIKEFSGAGCVEGWTLTSITYCTYYSATGREYCYDDVEADPMMDCT